MMLTCNKVALFFQKGSVLPLTFFVQHQQSIRCWCKVFKHNVLLPRNGNLRDLRWTTREIWFRNFFIHTNVHWLLVGMYIGHLKFSKNHDFSNQNTVSGDPSFDSSFSFLKKATSQLSLKKQIM